MGMASLRYDQLSLVVILDIKIFIITLWVQLSNTETTLCHLEKPLIIEDFQISYLHCKSNVETSYGMMIFCKSRNLGAWDHLSNGGFGRTNVFKTAFNNCSFPSGLSLHNVTKALGANAEHNLVIDKARTKLLREHLSGFYLNTLYLVNSSFDLDSEGKQLPGDLLHELRIKELYIQNIPLTSVPPGFFEGASKLQTLTIRDSRLRRVGRNDFVGLEDLRSLMLFGNTIEDIEGGSFDRLTNLEFLQLSDNRLRTLSSDVFHNLIHLEALNISSNEFDELPSKLLRINDSKLQSVWLNDNRGRMRSLPAGFYRNLSSLEYVELVGNNFTNIPADVFFGASFLATIHISDNSLTSLPAGLFETASKLRILTIRESGLLRVNHHDFVALENLRELVLFGNAIEEIEKGSFDRLINLQILDLNNNKLRTLSSEVFRNLVRLEELELSSNEFDELPSDLLRIHGSNLQSVWLNNNRGRMRSLPTGLYSNLSRLEYVELTGNNFTSIPGDIFFGASSLKILQISNNNLTSLPVRLFRGTSLVEVWASKNSLTSLPEYIFEGINIEKLHLNDNLLVNLTQSVLSGLGNLQILNLSYNNLRYIEPLICMELKKIKHIDLSYNQLDLVSRELPGMENFSVLVNCIYIEDLNLSYNKINRFFKDWNSYRNLRCLNLEGNKITHLTVKDLQVLKYSVALNLNNNDISAINMEGLEEAAAEYGKQNKMGKNTYVTLKNNPLNCDCQLLELFRYFEQKLNPVVYTYIKIEPEELNCTSPAQLRDTPISEIPSEKLRCLITRNETTNDDACNRNCICWWRIPDKKVLSVDCSYRNLTAVPPIVHNPYDSFIELNMSGNYLRSTPRMNVSYLANVTDLDLSFNNISLVTLDVFSSNTLRTLKLHNNSISRLDYDVVQHLYNDDLLSNITLYGNPYICNCGTDKMANFVKKKLIVFGLHSVTCFDTDRRLFEMTNDELCKDVNKFMSFVAFFCIILIALFSIFAAFYLKYKIKIKVWLYTKQCCIWLVREDELDKDKLYDAFISFSHKDEDFVEREIVSKLEEGSMPYKLCLHHRDWPAGEWIPAQIVRSVEESRRTIIIMSKNFLESVWGKMEFRTAHNQAISDGRSRIIVVLYGDIGNTEELDSELKAYLSTNTYLKWGDPWFWDKLRYALPHRHELTKRTRRQRKVNINENHVFQSETNNQESSL